MHLFVSKAGERMTKYVDESSDVLDYRSVVTHLDVKRRSNNKSSIIIHKTKRTEMTPCCDYASWPGNGRARSTSPSRPAVQDCGRDDGDISKSSWGRSTGAKKTLDPLAAPPAAFEVASFRHDLHHKMRIACLSLLSFDKEVLPCHLGSAPPVYRTKSPWSPNVKEY